MIPRSLRVLCATAALAFLPGDAEAQIGPFIDWIHKMSGPQFWGSGFSFSVGYRPGQFFDPGLLDEYMGALQVLASGPTPGPEFLSGALNTHRAALQDCNTTLGSVSGTIDFERPYEEGAVSRLRMELEAKQRYLARFNRAVATDAGDAIVALSQLAQAPCDFVPVMRKLNTGNADPYRGAVGRLTLFVGTDDANGEDGGYPIHVLSVQPTVGYVVDSIELEAGFSLDHYFGSIESFWHPHFPVLLSWRPIARRSSAFHNFRVGAGLRVYPAFASDAFGPAFDMNGETEIIGTIFAGVDFKLNY